VIPDGRAEISGHFTTKEANDLALLLRAGALPAPLHVIEERTVGPSLGADSIHDGQKATVFAFIFVSILMLLLYSVFGIFADIALAFNLLFLFAALSLLQATLTLPGIAGIALTIGMAVDANVLIYERIKEELRNGLRPVAAIDAGYKRAITTIMDSNLTTLTGAAVLFEFGTGPIRGFAVTLALGIIISLFTAISLTRLIIVAWLRGRNVTSLPI
jgi:preprotein translocase subunit SecD